MVKLVKESKVLEKSDKTMGARRVNERRISKTPVLTFKSRMLSTKKMAPLAKLSELGSILVEARKKDILVLRLASKKSYESLQGVVDRQAAMVKDALTEWKSVMKLMKHIGPKESIEHLEALGRGSLHLTQTSLRELRSLLVSTQAEAINIIRRRIDEDIVEISNLVGRIPKLADPIRTSSRKSPAASRRPGKLK